MKGYGGEEPDRYDRYRAKTFNMHHQNLREELSAINGGSLKSEDKIKLKAELIKQIADTFT